MIVGVRLLPTQVRARHSNVRTQLLLASLFQWIESGYILLRPVEWNDGLLYGSGLVSAVEAQGLSFFREITIVGDKAGRLLR